MMGGRQMMNSMFLSEMGMMGSTLAGYLFWWGSLTHLTSTIPIRGFIRRLKSGLYPEVNITVHEQNGDKSFSRNELYYAVETYLSELASGKANNLKAAVSNNGRSVALALDNREKMVDVFDGVLLQWVHHCDNPNPNGPGGSPDGAGGGGRGVGVGAAGRADKRYVLTFLRRSRPLVVGRYLSHVLERARELQSKSRKRKLYTNGPYSGAGWSSVLFDHPASFDTLAMEPLQKKRIMDDLLTFSKSKDYYAKIGRAWKRGYLLHGPPGTGKSTMIAAIANFLGYDIYDLELTAVGSNTELRNLLVSTTSKAIVVVEDIDCSLEVTAARKAPAAVARTRRRSWRKADAPAPSKPILFNGMNIHCFSGNELGSEWKNQKSEVTLSGLLNIIDGLWSVCGGERLIIFTTNHVEKLDPALIRKGRMDVHIEMSYCTFQGFKILAQNYLDIDHHPLFDVVERLMEEVEISPADIAEQLMPKTLDATTADKANTCLQDLIQSMTKSKEARRQG